MYGLMLESLLTKHYTTLAIQNACNWKDVSFSPHVSTMVVGIAYGSPHSYLIVGNTEKEKQKSINYESIFSGIIKTSKLMFTVTQTRDSLCGQTFP